MNANTEDQKCRLVFDRIEFDDHAHRVAWMYRHTENMCLKVVRREERKRPRMIVVRTDGKGIELDAIEILIQAMNQACWVPDLLQVVLTVPQWAADALAPRL